MNFGKDYRNTKKMTQNVIRVYADTSVFGGICDEEFAFASRKFFEQVKSGQFNLVASAIVQNEIAGAPERVKEFFNEMLAFAEIADISKEILQLRDAYLEAGILTPKYSDDALHVALATVSGCSLIVSWNFKHNVHFEKISLYNAVNTLKGYSHIDIFSPFEVINYEDQEI